MNSKIIFGIVIIVLIIGGFLIFQNRAVAPIEKEIDSNMPVPGSNVQETEVIKEISVEAIPFLFTPSVMSVNKGDTVKIVNGTHDLKIDEFNASTRLLKSGEEQTITFVADKVGTFEYYCSVGTHRAMGMV